MFYAYIIESMAHRGQRYIGFSEDLRQRIKEHNSGKCPHTSKLRPWRLIFYAAFADKQKAFALSRIKRFLNKDMLTCLQCRNRNPGMCKIRSKNHYRITFDIPQAFTKIIENRNILKTTLFCREFRTERIFVA